MVIEKQYGVGNHDLLTRALAYAVGSDARALIVVAEHHRGEFVSVADYLNEVGGLSEEGILVWLVRVRARRIGDAIWSPAFVIQAEPNQWEANVRRITTPRLTSLGDFYERCIDAEWADTARAIIDSCLDKGMTEARTASQAVSLYQPLPERRAGVPT